jgi:hypothetical protein
MEQLVERFSQRVRCERHRAPLLQVQLGPSVVALASVRHRKRIVDDRRPVVERERLFQILHRSRVLFPRQRRPSQTIVRRSRARLE